MLLQMVIVDRQRLLAIDPEIAWWHVIIEKPDIVQSEDDWTGYCSTSLRFHKGVRRRSSDIIYCMYLEGIWLY